MSNTNSDTALRRKVATAMATPTNPDLGYQALDTAAAAVGYALLPDWPEGFETRLGRLHYGARLYRQDGELKMELPAAYAQVTRPSTSKYDFRAKARFLRKIDRVVSRVERRNARIRTTVEQTVNGLDRGTLRAQAKARKAIGSIEKTASRLESGPTLTER